MWEEVVGGSLCNFCRLLVHLGEFIARGFAFIFLLYKVVIWYMDLAAPTMEQSGLVSIVVGAGAAWFGLYTGSRSGKK